MTFSYPPITFSFFSGGPGTGPEPTDPTIVRTNEGQVLTTNAGEVIHINT